MFAGDTNFFVVVVVVVIVVVVVEHSSINTLFKTNDELIKINEWFSANKLSLTVGKTKF